MTKEVVPDFLKNPNGIFYPTGKNSNFSFWSNMFGDMITESLKTGVCDITVKDIREDPILVCGLKDFDAAIDKLISIKRSVNARRSD